jgi:hypothetical protein
LSALSPLSRLSRLSLIATEQTQHAQQALESLATGIDPAGGAELGPTTAWKVLRRPEIIRALLLGARAVDRLAEVGEVEWWRLALQAPALGASKQAIPGQARAGQAWSASEDNTLLRSYDSGVPIERLANLHGRSSRSIAARLVRLGRINERSDVFLRAQASSLTGAVPRNPGHPEDTGTLRPSPVVVVPGRRSASGQWPHQEVA